MEGGSVWVKGQEEGKMERGRMVKESEQRTRGIYGGKEEGRTEGRTGEG